MQASGGKAFQRKTIPAMQVPGGIASAKAFEAGACLVLRNSREASLDGQNE